MRSGTDGTASEVASCSKVAPKSEDQHLQVAEEPNHASGQPEGSDDWNGQQAESIQDPCTAAFMAGLQVAGGYTQGQATFTLR